MSETTPDRLAIHKLLSEEMRHTATIIWQYSIAIVTLQYGALTLSAHNGFQTPLGKCVLGVGFFLSASFSLMLVRQAMERCGFRDRIRAIEDELTLFYPNFLIERNRCPRWYHFRWYTTVIFAWLLLCLSAVAFVVFLCFTFLYPTLPAAKASTPTMNAIQVQIAPGQTITYPVEPSKNYMIELEAGKVKFSATK